MSLILEALKRSEAERRLGETPDLLAAPMPVFAAPPSPPVSTLRWVLGALVVGLLAVAIAGWMWSQRTAQEDPSATSPVTAPESIPLARTEGTVAGERAPATDAAPALLGIPPVPTRAPGAPDTSRAAAPTVPPNPATTQSAIPAAAQPTAPPDPTAPLLLPDTVIGQSPVPVEPQRPPPEPAFANPQDGNDPPNAPVGPLEIPSAPAAAVIASPRVEGTAPVTADPIVAPPESPASELPDRSDLPLAIRQSLPPLVLNMHLYRATPSERIVILDGKRLQEGDSSGDIQVEEIRSDGVILLAQGQRFLLSRLPP